MPAPEHLGPRRRCAQSFPGVPPPHGTLKAARRAGPRWERREPALYLRATTEYPPVMRSLRDRPERKAVFIYSSGNKMGKRRWIPQAASKGQRRTSWEVFKSTEEAEGSSFAGPHA